MHHVVVELAYALSNVVHGPVRVLLFVEQFGLHCVYDYLDRGHIQDSIMQKIIEALHVVK